MKLEVKRTLCITGLWAATALVSGCAPLLVGGAIVGGGMVAVDRRTSGAQLEDEGIELRAGNRLRDNLSERGHVNVSSYNRQVLLTGEVPSAQDKALAERAVGTVENVRSVVNELGVLGSSTFSQRSADTLVTARVKAALLDVRELQASAFRVITERGTTYLMGRVTQREADRATEVVRSVEGVQRVVRVFEYLTEQELQRLQPQPRSGS